MQTIPGFYVAFAAEAHVHGLKHELQNFRVRVYEAMLTGRMLLLDPQVPIYLRTACPAVVMCRLMIWYVSYDVGSGMNPR